MVQCLIIIIIIIIGARYEVGMGKWRVLVGKPERKRPLGRPMEMGG